MRKLASIQTVNAVEPIPNADAIEKVRVLGWWVVSKKGEHRPGDKLVYCEIDSLLPERPEFEFLRASSFRAAQTDPAGGVTLPAGFRIKTVKLRGQVSQGICFPLSVLPPGHTGNPPSYASGTGCYLGVLAYVLPYVEQDAVYRLIQADWSTNPPAGNPWWSVAQNVRAARTRIKTYQCPSDSLEEVLESPDALVVVSMWLDAVFYHGDGFAAKSFGGTGIGLTNYLGVAGVWATCPCSATTTCSCRSTGACSTTSAGPGGTR